MLDHRLDSLAADGSKAGGAGETPADATVAKTLPAVRLAFFDIDGVLSAPEYRDGDTPVIGFSPDGWRRWCEAEGEAAYRYCRVVPQVRDFAAALRRNGAEVVALSTSCSAAETLAKRAFLRERYAGIVQGLEVVSRDGGKVPRIRRMAGERGLALGSCLLVEDTFATLLAAHAAGIVAVHVSNVVAGNPTR